MYSVKVACRNIMSQSLQAFQFRFDIFWKTKAIPFPLFFVWRLINRKVATYENLIHREVQVGAGLCVLYGSQQDNANHLFFTCKVASKVWCMCDVW